MKTWVTWKSIQLSAMLQFPPRGYIVKFGKTPNGGDCWVRWNEYPNKDIEECMSNLEILEVK